MNSIIFIPLKRQNKYILYSLLILFISSFYIILSTMNSVFDYNIEVIKNKEENRSLQLRSPNDLIEHLKSSDYVLKFHNLYDTIYVESDNKYVNLNVYQNESIKIGRKPKNDKEVVISKSYYNILKLTKKMF